MTDRATAGVRDGLTVRGIPGNVKAIGYHESKSKKARQVLRAFSSFWLKNYLVSLLGEAVNSFGFAIGRAVRLTSVGAPAAAP